MLNVMKKLWHDERGFVNSTELLLIATLAVLGLIVGLATLRDSIISELGDTSSAVGAANQSYSVNIDSNGINPNVGTSITADAMTGEVELARNFQSSGTTVVRVRASFNNFEYVDAPEATDGVPTVGTLPNAVFEYGPATDETP